jgi:soluble P-type ATPase
MADHIRIEAPTVLRRIRDSRIKRIVLMTGDHPARARSVATTLGIDEFKSDMTPQDKIAAVQEEKAHGRVIMVGDGVNDAPALAAADVGVAMGARGAAASSEAANVVLLVDRLDRLVTARQIADRSMAIARQSAVAGILLSAAAMVLAMTGHLSPVAGALLQEAIDVAVIVNALRALGRPAWPGGRHRSLTAEELCKLEAEHRQIADVIDQTASLADSVADLTGNELHCRLNELDALLDERLLQHERSDEDELFPRLRGTFGREPIFTGLSRTHMEIRSRVHMFKIMVQSLPADPGTIERRDIQRLLDGLVAIATLHFEEEEEVYRLLEAG